MGFATPANMLQRYDARVIGQLVGDLGVTVSPAALITDPVLLAFLDDASGLVLAACLRGERYSLADLTGLSGVSANHLIRITCDLCMAALYGRRYDENYAESRPKAEEVAEKHLERLRRGEHVFDIDQTQEASHPEMATPSLADVIARNGIRQSVHGYFPLRGCGGAGE